MNEITCNMIKQCHDYAAHAVLFLDETERQSHGGADEQ
jgi:hypothetical protein